MYSYVHLLVFNIIIEYKITSNGQKWIYQSTYQLRIPQQYNFQVNVVEDQNHSIPSASLNLIDRTKYKGTVVYSHGNSSDLSNSLLFLTNFASNLPIFDYVAYDYSGYGDSRKKQVNQQSIWEDLQILLNNLNIQPEQTILWGFSLGAFPTVKVATLNRYLGVIVHSSMASLYSLVQAPSVFDNIKNDNFNVIDMIAKINSFLIILHSKDDDVIPFSHAQALFERYRMLNSNPYCFLLQVSKLRHNSMHSLLVSKKQNQLKKKLFETIDLMLKPQVLTKAQVFKLQKQKYFEQITKKQKGQQINVDNRQIIESTPTNVITNKSQMKLKQIKNFTFQIDQIQTQQITRLDYYLDIKAYKHSQYFGKIQEFPVQKKNIKTQSESMSSVLNQQILQYQPNQ